MKWNVPQSNNTKDKESSWSSTPLVRDIICYSMSVVI